MKKLLTLFLFFFASHLHALINWGAPTTISTAGVNASDPQIVTDANGNATAAWVENAVIKTSSMPAGGSWGAIATLSNTSKTSSTPLLGIDGNGNVTAVWLESGIVNTSKLPFGGSWSAETALSNSGGGATDLTLCVDNSGNVAAAWARSGYIEAIQYSVSLSAWSSVTRISTNGADDNPNIYIGTGGTIVAVWHSVVSGNDLVYSASGSVNGNGVVNLLTGLLNGNWGTPIDIIPSALDSAHYNYPKVVVDSTGNAYAVWYHYMVSGTTYSDVGVLSSTLSASGTAWSSSPLELSEGDGLYNPAYLFLRIAINTDDNIITLWSNSYDGYTFAIESGVLAYLQDWQSPSSIILNNIYAYQVDVKATSVATCIANFMYYDGSNVVIQSAETSINGYYLNFWSVSSTISEGASNAYPRVAAEYQPLSNTLYGASVWLNYNGTNNVIMASLGSETVIAPPTNVHVAQSSNNLGVFTEYYNTITWTASPDPSVTQYILYRNEIAFQTLDSTMTQFIDHNAIQNQAVTYGIAAVGPYQILSSVVNASYP